MSTTLHVHAPAQPVTSPAHTFFGRIAEVFHAYVKAYGAQRELRQRWRDAARLRALADHLQKSDPGMASDLRCAIDRYY
jgi:hypothetical protein